jgi:hypothetical protein
MSNTHFHGRARITAATALLVISGALCLPAEAQIYVPENQFTPVIRIEAFSPTATPMLSESDSLSDPARWQLHGYAVGVGCRSNGQIPPPPRNTFISCAGGIDSAYAGVEFDAGRIRIGTDASAQNISSATAEIRDFVTFNGPAATVPVTWTINVEGSIFRRLQDPNNFTGTHSASADLDTWVQVGGLFSEGTGDDLGIGIHASGSTSHQADQPAQYFSSDQVFPLYDFQNSGNPYQGGLTHSFAGLRDSSQSHSDNTTSLHTFPSPAGPVPPAITVTLPTGTPLPVVIYAHSNSQCFTVGGSCSAEADFGNTIHVVASVPSGFTLTSQGGYSYTGETTPPVSTEPGALQFAEADGSIDESVGTLTLQVTRTDGGFGEVAVRVMTRATGTATAAADFTAVDTIVTFADGDTTAKSVNIPVIEDSADEPTETFTVELTSATGGATLGQRLNATISIRDNDPPPGPAPVATSGGGGALQVEFIGALFMILVLRWLAASSGAGPATASRKKARSAIRR